MLSCFKQESIARRVERLPSPHTKDSDPPLNLRCAKLFTLNYDTLIEKVADAEGVLIVDGLLESLYCLI